jgi:hypothetical protein
MQYRFIQSEKEWEARGGGWVGEELIVLRFICFQINLGFDAAIFFLFVHKKNKTKINTF